MRHQVTICVDGLAGGETLAEADGAVALGQAFQLEQIRSNWNGFLAIPLGRRHDLER